MDESEEGQDIFSKPAASISGGFAGIKLVRVSGPKLIPTQVMAEILHLEYICTKKEREEAQSLDLEKKLGGGSKVLTFAVIAGLCGLMYWRVRTEIPPEQLVWLVFLSAVIWFVFVKRLRDSRDRNTKPIRVGVSENGIMILSEGSRTTMPWSAFNDCLESKNLFVLRDRPKAVLIIIPKRVFPDVDSQNRFRELSANRNSGTATPAEEPRIVPALGHAENIVIKLKLGFLDYLDRSAASWRTGIFILAFAGIMIGTTIYASANPPPHPVYSMTQVFFLFELPFLFVAMPFFILLSATYSWFAHLRYLIPQEWVLSEQCLLSSSRDESSSLPWATYPRYKETRWSFILWNPKGGLWMLLPKRAFASDEDLRNCRALLARQSRKSPWFFG